MGGPTLTTWLRGRELILYYPELLGVSLPENPSRVFASGGRRETARVGVGSPDHISPFDHAESTYTLHFAVRASPSTVYARGRATSHRLIGLVG